MNFIPYLRVSTTKGYLNFLVDTGANKSYIDPSHINKAKTTKRPAVVSNKNGKFTIDSIVHMNLFPEASEKRLPYYVFKFHNFFDGLIGYENLAALHAVIDTTKDYININKCKYTISKYYPTSVNFNEVHEDIFEICTTANGSFLIDQEIELNANIILKPGVYEAQNNKAFVHLSSKDKSVKGDVALPPFPSDAFELESNYQKSKPSLNFPSDHLNSEEKNALVKTLKPFKDVFFSEDKTLTFTHEVKHSINTADEKPIHQKTYKYPYHLREEVSTQIRKMLDNGIIRESSSQWTSPIWVVPKKIDNSGQRKYRIVVDYRKLNEKTPADRYPIPEVSEILDRLGKAQYFSVLDLASGFHQIEVDTKDIPKTAFNIDHGKYEFVRMPFGLKNAPATFQRLMDSVLRKHLGIRCFVYMDDIIIYSTNLQTHLEDIRKVLQTLRDANLKVQCDKSDFLRKEVEFLGHVVTTEGVKPNPNKIEAIKSWPLPKTSKELKSFLGTIGYYRRFIPKFAHIAKPMTIKLRGKTKSIEIDHDYEKAFEELKKIMTTDTLLAYPNFDEPFILTTDASNFAIGAVLAQLQAGKERPIAYLSRTLSKAEEKYSATAKELLAIYFSAKTFRPYLYGREFSIYTDHEPLTKELKLTDSTGRVTRQRLYLEQFDFKLIYKKGKQNVVADGLSRIPRSELNLNEELSNEIYGYDPIYDPEIINKYANQIIIRISNDTRRSPYLACKIFPGNFRHVFHKPDYTNHDLKDILEKHLNPTKLNGIFAEPKIAKQCKEIIESNFNKIKVRFSNMKLPDIISGKDQSEFIRKSHNFNHRGYKLTYEEVQKSVYFPQMLAKVRDFIRNCESCKFAKYERRPFKIPLTRRIYNGPFENVNIDVFVKETEKFLTLVDAFSKFAQIYKIANETTEEITETLIEYFKTFGLPKMITCDQSTSFRNAKFKEFLETHGIKLHFASCSDSNGIVERFHNTLLEMYLANRSKVEQLTLYEGLAMITAIYNDTTHSTIKLKPREVIFGTCASLDPIEINVAKQITLQNAKDSLTTLAKNHNAKIQLIDKEEFKNINRQRLLVKGKAKPTPSGNRYRLIDTLHESDKTVTDKSGIKTHKKHIKRNFTDN